MKYKNFTIYLSGTSKTKVVLFGGQRYEFKTYKQAKQFINDISEQPVYQLASDSDKPVTTQASVRIEDNMDKDYKSYGFSIDTINGEAKIWNKDYDIVDVVYLHDFLVEFHEKAQKRVKECIDQNAPYLEPLPKEDWQEIILTTIGAYAVTG